MRAAILLVVAGCGAGTITAEQRGEELLCTSDLSDSPANAFACCDCHQTTPGGGGDRIFPGYTLVDSAFRESYWGGYERTLLEAMSFCRVGFMRGVELHEDDRDARAILEYLLSVSETNPAPALPLTVRADIVDVPRGEPQAGAELYRRACHHCHGSPGGPVPRRFREDATLIPDDAAGWVELFGEDFPDTPEGLIVIEKIQHGRFFGISGVMPLFSTETMSDEDIGAILAYLGI